MAASISLQQKTLLQAQAKKPTIQIAGKPSGAAQPNAAAKPQAGLNFQYKYTEPVAKPNFQVAKFKGQVAKPNGQVAKPNGQVAKPNGVAVAKLKVQTNKVAGKPHAAVAKPNSAAKLTAKEKKNAKFQAALAAGKPWATGKPWVPPNAKGRAALKYFTGLKEVQLSRKEAFAKSLEPSNKGYQMLQRMGYAAGTGLGRNGEGITVPLSFELKVDRQGLEDGKGALTLPTETTEVPGSSAKPKVAKKKWVSHRQFNKKGKK